MFQIPPTEEWVETVNGFATVWNFPRCLDAIDGKHIQIQALEDSKSLFCNYKGTFSVVLLATVDAHHNVIYADAGYQCRISDGGIFKVTSIYKKMESNLLKLPPSSTFSGKKYTSSICVCGRQCICFVK